MGIKFSNNASSNITHALTADATSVSITPGTGDLFPSIVEGTDYFYATLAGNNGLEIVKVTRRVLDTMTIERAQDGTDALLFNQGDLFELRIVAADFEDTFSHVETTLEDTVSNVEATLEDTVDMLTSSVDSKLSSYLPLSGGTMLGSLTLPRFTFTPGVDASYIFAQPDDVWANGARIQLNPGSLGGDLTLLAAKDGIGTSFNVKPGDGAYINAGKVITSAGGTMTGVIESNANNSLYVVREQGETIAVRAANVNTGKAVRFGVGASGARGIYDESSASWLISYSASGDKLMSKGATVHTSADGQLMNKNNVEMWYDSSATLPSGASWSVLGIRVASNGTISDTLFNRYAGGTTVSLGGSGQGYIMAWRIS